MYHIISVYTTKILPHENLPPYGIDLNESEQLLILSAHAQGL